MNLLLDCLPKSVEINNIQYVINSDFRTSIKFELLMQDNDIELEVKVLKALQLYYPVIPQNTQKAIDKILWFFSCGKTVQTSNINVTHTNRNQIQYSFEEDDQYIYAAFLNQYNIDLQEVNYLHWWKFRAMFKCLKSDNLIVKIMEYRTVNLNSIPKEQKDFYKEMKQLYCLKSDSTHLTYEEYKNSMKDYFNKRFENLQIMNKG